MEQIEFSDFDISKLALCCEVKDDSAEVLETPRLPPERRTLLFTRPTVVIPESLGPAVPDLAPGVEPSVPRCDGAPSAAFPKRDKSASEVNLATIRVRDRSRSRERGDPRAEPARVKVRRPRGGGHPRAAAERIAADPSRECSALYARSFLDEFSVEVRGGRRLYVSLVHAMWCATEPLDILLMEEAILMNGVLCTSGGCPVVVNDGGTRCSRHANVERQSAAASLPPRVKERMRQPSVHTYQRFAQRFQGERFQEEPRKWICDPALGLTLAS